LDAYHAIAMQAPARLMAGGRILLEIGPTQAAAVSDMLARQGLQNIRVLQDLDQRDRVVAAEKPHDPDSCGTV
jgi:release factor glutamine methyltransferase